jgi:hypothetical protein
MNVEMVPIMQVDLDLDNPRIARLISMYKPEEINSEMIAMALGSGDTQEGDTYATYRNLRESIRTNGGVIHPIIVNRNKTGKMTVVEGNTRLQIYREFASESKPGNWAAIPAIVYEDLPRVNIDAIRLQAHLVGPRPWDPYSKARYLHMLSNQNLMTIDQIVECCGGKRKQVMEYIQAFTDMEEFYRPALENSDDFDPTRFSAFVELQRNSIQRALLDNKFAKRDFAQWVVKGLFSPLETVRSLPDILSDEAARRVFLEDGAATARTKLSKASGETQEMLEKIGVVDLANEVAKRLGRISHSEWRRLQSNPKDAERVALKGLKWQLDDTLSGIEEEGGA